MNRADEVYKMRFHGGPKKGPLAHPTVHDGGEKSATDKEVDQLIKKKVRKNVDDSMSELQREITNLSSKSASIARQLKSISPDDIKKYELVLEVEKQLDILRKQIFDIRE